MTQLDDLTALAGAVEAGTALERCRVVQSHADWVELEHDELAVLLVAPTLWRGEHTELRKQLLRTGGHRTLVLCVGDAAAMAAFTERTFEGQTCVVPLPLPATADVLRATVVSGVRMVASLKAARERGQTAERTQFELGELIAIANAINSERDVSRLLSLILEKSRYVTGADAGSIYVVVQHPHREGDRALRFEVAQNESLAVDFKSFTLDVSERSIVGAAVVRREVINIPDLYRLEEHNPWGVEHDRSFDERTGYRTHSILAVPLINQRDVVIGVLQLINKKTTPGRPLEHRADFEASVVPFDEHSVALCKTLASQAGVSLENGLLYDELRQVFEGFVEASVQAIEARDPTTSGHSRRVADLTVGLAQVVDRCDEGALGPLAFSTDELKAIEYAGLLHDFGKIGVPEAVLLKGHKLFDWERDILLARFDYIRQRVRTDYLQKKLALALGQGAAARVQLAALDDALAKQLEYLDGCIATVLDANRPTVLDKDGPQQLQEIARQTYLDGRGEARPYLLPREVECLSIARGSLSSEERRQIESHVVHTYAYLCTIPWGQRFRSIPAIAGAHHEKLDGSGYPAGKTAEQIPIQAKMMAIADIFDALTASDRPYKKAVPWQKALDILDDEVRRGKLDEALFRLFVDADVWRRVIP